MSSRCPKRWLVAMRGMAHLVTGDMLRTAVAAQTPVGVQAEAVMSAGGLVSDAVVSALIGERLDGVTERGRIIFDGDPRTLVQAEALDLGAVHRGNRGRRADRRAGLARR